MTATCSQYRERSIAGGGTTTAVTFGASERVSVAVAVTGACEPSTAPRPWATMYVVGAPLQIARVGAAEAAVGGA